MDQDSNQIEQHKVIQVKTIQRRSKSPFSKTLSNNQTTKHKTQSQWKPFTQMKGKNQLYLPFTKNKTASNYARKYIVNRPKNIQRQTDNKQQKRDMSFAPKHQQQKKNELSLSLPTLKKKNQSMEKRKEKQLKQQFLDDQDKDVQSQENSQMVFVKFFNKRFSVQLQNCQLQHFFIKQKKYFACFNTTEGFIKRFNEDRITVINELPPRKNYKGKWPQISFFGIYDGHGGDWVSEYLKTHLHEYIIASEHFPNNIKEAIEEGCKEIEDNIIQQSQQQDSKRRAGSCAVFAFIYKNQVCIGNIGDSRIVVSENQGANALSLTTDHKPQLKSEERRIVRNGGQVMKSKNVSKQNLEKAPLRVYPGGLSVSRTFGDFNAKDVNSGGLQGTVIATPEITFYKITSNTDFLFLGCDGIYDIFTTQELVEKVWIYKQLYTNIKKTKGYSNYLGAITNQLLNQTMVKGGYDNLSIILIPLTNLNAKVFIDESQNYFTDLRKLNDLVQNNEQLLTCFFERDFQLDSSVSCVDKNSLDLLQKHFAGHLDNIIKLSLKQQPDCYHLNDENKALVCKEFLKDKVVEKTNFPIESDEEKQVLDQVVNIVLKTFKKLQKEKQNQLEMYKKQPFLKNINDYIKNDIIANLLNKPNKKDKPLQKPVVQNNVQVKENKIIADVKKDQFEEYLEISDKEKEEIKKLQNDLQEDFDVHAYENQFQLKNSLGINEDQFKTDLKNIDDSSNQIMANLVLKIEDLNKQKEIKQNEKINLKFKDYQSDPEKQIDDHIRDLTKLYNKTSSHMNLIRQIEEQMMDLFYKMLLFRNRQIPEGTKISKSEFFSKLQHEIYDIKEHIENNINIIQKHLTIIKSNSDIQITQPQVEYQFEQYLNKEIPNSSFYDDLRTYLDQVRKIKSDYELIRDNYQSQLNELREQINDLKLWQKMIDDLNTDIQGLEIKIQNAKKKQYKILSIGIEEERITKIMDEMTMLDKDRIKKMKLVGTLKQEVENLRKTNIIKAVEYIKEAIQQQNEILNNEHNDKDKIVQEIQQSIENLKTRMEQVKDEPLLL